MTIVPKEPEAPSQAGPLQEVEEIAHIFYTAKYFTLLLRYVVTGHRVKELSLLFLGRQLKGHNFRLGSRSAATNDVGLSTDCQGVLLNTVNQFDLKIFRFLLEHKICHDPLAAVMRIEIVSEGSYISGGKSYVMLKHIPRCKSWLVTK